MAAGATQSVQLPTEEARKQFFSVLQYDEEDRKSVHTKTGRQSAEANDAEVSSDDENDYPELMCEEEVFPTTMWTEQPISNSEEEEKSW